MMTRRSHPPTNRRVISINKFNSRSGRRVLPGLSFENDNSRKNYLPLGALSSASNPLVSTPRPISRNVNFPSSPKPIPVSIPVAEGRSFSSRKMDSRTLVRIVPQKLRPGFNSRRNLTSKFKDSIANLHLKNWPNEAMQSVQDLLNYEKYTSFHDDKNSAEISKPKVTSNRDPTKKPVTYQPTSWTRPPVTETTILPTTYLPTTKFDYETTMAIDSLLDDLAKNKRIPTTSSEVMQNTVVHILNAGSKKPNITVVEPPPSTKNVNKVKPGSKRPPQNVHIMFMVDKDETGNQTSAQAKPPAQLLGGDSDCPTIMINSITQINNTIQSKEGCTDLNIVINSHVLNTNNIIKPSASPHIPSPGTEGPKNPYGPDSSPYPTNSYPNTYYPNTNYPNYPTASYPNNNYNDEGKDPEGQSDIGDSGVHTFEVFQGTHINIGGNPPAINYPENTGIADGDDPIGSDTDGVPLTDPTEATNDIIGTAPEESLPDAPIDGGESVDGLEQVDLGTGPGGVANDIGTGEALNGPGEANLPELPGLPNLPNLPDLPDLPGGNGGNNGGQTGLAPIADEEEEEDEVDELVEALSPVGLLDSISSVFNTFSFLNPLNYGIFGVAVAPFVAFAAGILGVAAFLFPWAFPGYTIPGVVSRAWSDGWNGAHHKKILYSPYLRDMVHSSIHKYRHLNEWKGRRRRKKRKR